MFFAAGGRHTPGWNWVWKAYRSLSRKYRKNLKRLVSVEYFTKAIVRLGLEAFTLWPLNIPYKGSLCVVQTMTRTAF